MPITGNIDLKQVRATYTIEDIHFVPLGEINRVNEDRLFFEIFFSVALGMFGIGTSIIKIKERIEFALDYHFLITGIIFFIISIIFLIKYFLKKGKLSNKKMDISLNPILRLRLDYLKTLSPRLVRDKDSPTKVYFISNNKKRHIATQKTFDALGLNTKDVEKVTREELDKFEELPLIKIE